MAAPATEVRVKRFLKRFPLLVRINFLIWRMRDRSHRTALHVIDRFPLFAPYSGGSYKARAAITIRTINATLPLLAALADATRRPAPTDVRADALHGVFGDGGDAAALGQLFDRYGSDKTPHRYHHLYAAILADRRSIKSIFEIGLGSNYDDAVSGMGPTGKPGASLRAFRDFCPNAMVFGADIDTRILFEEERIRTFFVDQTQPETFAALALPDALDLVIDDGLHAPDANLATLTYALAKVRDGGWIVIEDISSHATPLWRTVAALLPHRSYLIEAGDTYLFAVQVRKAAAA